MFRLVNVTRVSGLPLFTRGPDMQVTQFCMPGLHSLFRQGYADCVKAMYLQFIKVPFSICFAYVQLQIWYTIWRCDLEAFNVSSFLHSYLVLRTSTTVTFVPRRDNSVLVQWLGSQENLRESCEDQIPPVGWSSRSQTVTFFFQKDWSSPIRTSPKHINVNLQGRLP